MSELETLRAENARLKKLVEKPQEVLRKGLEMYLLAIADKVQEHKPERGQIADLIRDHAHVAIDIIWHDRDKL